MKPDVIINVRFLTTEEGGRKTAIQGQTYACPLFIDNEGFDCRLLLDGRHLELGVIYDIPVKFLYRDLVYPKLAVGKSVSLWEGKTVAIGQVIQVFAE